MNKCSFCDKKYSNDAVTPILVKGMDFCTAEPDDVEISNKHVCASCLAASVNYPNEAKYGLCGLDTEQSYALHASDLTFYMCSSCFRFNFLYGSILLQRAYF